MAKAPRNVHASVRARLLALAREKGQAFDLLLTRYGLERLLYRLSISPYRLMQRSRSLSINQCRNRVASEVPQ